jgi:LacI family transcriptional regulator
MCQPIVIGARALEMSLEITPKYINSNSIIDVITPMLGADMPRKPTIIDIARETGLGAATVDRVIHARPNVSERAKEQVAKAAQKLGYPLPMSLRALPNSSLPMLNLGFVLHKRGQAFYQNFAKEIEAACRARRDVNIRAHIRFSASQSPDDFAKELRAAAENCQAIAATAVNHSSLTRLAEELTGSGIPVFSMLNDFALSAGSGYFGLDNMKVGRLAGWMMATRLQSHCRVAVFIGGARWHGQAMRETGFRSYLREHAPRISVLDTAVNLETRQLTHEATLDLLARTPDLAGLYVAGGGMEGAISALREARPSDKITLIVNELTPDSSQGLADRYVTMVIATPLQQLCADLIDRMARHVLDPDGKHRNRAELHPQLYLPESV